MLQTLLNLRNFPTCTFIKIWRWFTRETKIPTCTALFDPALLLFFRILPTFTIIRETKVTSIRALSYKNWANLVCNLERAFVSKEPHRLNLKVVFKGILFSESLITNVIKKNKAFQSAAFPQQLHFLEPWENPIKNP